MELTVNGVVRDLPDSHAGESLLALLRDGLGLTGTKNACEQGECGSCTVAIDGELACACLVPAIQARGAHVETVESLAGADGALHPIQDAFLAAGAVQCGFCTPGFLIATRDLLRRIPEPSDDDIRHELAGNLCRCTGYHAIVDAVRLAATERSS
jgi:carbon-monoxide dehydrogenase small subunit